MFQDTCSIYSVTHDKWGNEVPDEPVEMECTFVQRIDMEHESYRDTITSDSVLILPDNDFTSDNNYRLEGMIAVVNPFGNTDAQQHFRITAVAIARDVLLNNIVEHIECGLEKIEDFNYVS